MKTIEVAAGLVFRDGKLLITRRFDDAHLGGLWEFPGGKLEPGETYPVCLARELREELGIEVEVCELVESLTHPYPEKTVHLRFFQCRWASGEAKPLGCAALEWILTPELSRYEFPAADARLIERLQKESKWWR
jgi:mutator protein MutT